MNFDSRLRSPREPALFAIGVVLSSIAWFALVITLLGLIYAIPIAIFVMAAHALMLAHVRGNGVRVSETQLPDIHTSVRNAAARLGMDGVPDVFVMQAGGVLNAFATKLLSRRFVVIYSELVDHCEDPRQLDFVVAHEVAHLAAGHLAWNAFLAPFALVPWLGAAYSRAREYTCDRAGFFVVDDLESSLRGLCVLAAGGKLAARVDLKAFVAQREETGSFWMTVAELVSSHPYLCKRAGALMEMNAPGTIRPVRRSVLGFGLAPMLGMASAGTGGGLLVPVAIIGVLAAIAIPNFVRYQQRAHAAAERAHAPAAQVASPADAEDTGAAPDDGKGSDEGK